MHQRPVRRSCFFLSLRCLVRVPLGRHHTTLRTTLSLQQRGLHSTPCISYSRFQGSEKHSWNQKLGGLLAMWNRPRTFVKCLEWSLGKGAGHLPDCGHRLTLPTFCTWQGKAGCCTPARAAPLQTPCSVELWLFWNLISGACIATSKPKRLTNRIPRDLLGQVISFILWCFSVFIYPEFCSPISLGCPRPVVTPCFIGTPRNILCLAKLPFFGQRI